MAKDPAFLFYPGDYLRDTQNLGEAAQVAYDRIMCEHMRNICISQKQLNFFTKRMNESDVDELMFVLEECEGGFHIPWVSESITKRKQYSESRRNNRKGKKTNNISSTYDKHMENEIEDVIVNKKETKKKRLKEKDREVEFPYTSDRFMSQWGLWCEYRVKDLGTKPYKAIGEQAALLKLTKVSSDEDEAIAVIQQSIENSWKGLFELKNYGKNKRNNQDSTKTRQDLARAFAEEAIKRGELSES